jgi:hypothetical protein
MLRQNLSTTLYCFTFNLQLQHLHLTMMRFRLVIWLRDFNIDGSH